MPIQITTALKNYKKYFILAVSALLIAACSGGNTGNNYKMLYESPTAYYEVPPDLRSDEALSNVIKKYSNDLDSVKIFIDPGHGGDDRKNKSLSGKAVEADINLNVAFYLKLFLEEAGAVVKMSREKDVTVDLKERPEMANDWKADIFISIHHNASAAAEDYWTNYTSTYYHAKPGDYEHEPYSKDLARFIQRDLSYVMNTPGGLGSFDGTYTDYRIFPAEGFAVLRLTEMPAVLIECSFHTNRMEEERLLIDEFNKIQAWGIFKGLGRFFTQNRPEITLLKERSTLVNDTLSIVLDVKDDDPIDECSITVFFDSVKTIHKFSVSENKIYVSIPGVSAGEHILRILCADIYGLYSKPWIRKIITN